MRLDKILIFLAILSGLVLIYFVISSGKNENLKDNPSSQNNINPSSDEETNFQDENTNSEQDSNSQNAGATSSDGGSSGGSVGGSETASGSSSTLPSGCQLIQLSYALKKFQKNVICVEYSEEACINKEVTCSVEVHNLDYATSGTFEIEFSFLNEAQETLATETDSESIAQRTNKVLSATKTFQGENANQELECDFRTTAIPNKEVC